MKAALLKYNYPQRVFGKETAKYILAHFPDTKLIVDCPCGNGETTWHLSQINNVRILASDISNEAIKSAQANFSNKNIDYSCKDISESITSLKEDSVFCLINSLFLFPNAVQVLKELQLQINNTKSKLIVIVPNTKGKNFLWFQKKSPDENKLILDFEELKPFFEKLKFNVAFVKPICYTHHFNRKDVRLFSVFWSLYLNCLNKLQTALKIGKPNYFFIALTA